MSFAASLVWSLLRAVVVAAIAVPVSAMQETAVRQQSGARRRWLLGLLLAPLFAPDLLVGYAYARFDLSLLHRPLWNEALYLCLVTLKFVPAGLVLRLIAPPPLESPEARHCRRLLLAVSATRADRLGLGRMAAPSLAAAVALLVFLLTFQEFEIASEMSVAAWSVHLFDSQARGLNLTTLLERSIVPAVLQLMMAALLVVLLIRWTQTERPHWNEYRLEVDSGRSGRTGWWLSAAGVALLWGLPVGIVGVSGLSAVRSLTENPTLVRSFVPELTVAVILAAAAGCGAAALSAWLSRRLRAVSLRRVDRVWRVGESPLPDPLPKGERGPGYDGRSRSGLVLLVTGACLTAGAMGSLVLSALMLAAIQLPVLVEFRDTVFPLVATLILVLIPRGLFLFLLVAPLMVRESDYLAGLLTRGAENSQRSRQGARYLWASGPRRTLLLTGLLAWWAFLNLTATAMLCPASISLPGTSGAIVPLPVRLYNLMHYGRNGPLSLMTLLSVLVPLTLFVLLERLLAYAWRRRKL